MGNKSKLYLTNIIIIDWDDTLFPTSWINKNNIKFDDTNTIDKYKLYFLELDKTISSFLESLQKISDVYIVTNANINWIKSCLQMLHLTANAIIKNNIRLVSARDNYSNKKDSPTEWKIFTFQDIINDILNKINFNFKKNTILNIISLGDAMYEYIALIKLNTFLKKFIEDKLKNNDCNFNYLLKNIKFMDKPEFNYIIDQIQLVDKKKDEIINKLSYIDMKFN